MGVLPQLDSPQSEALARIEKQLELMTDQGDEEQWHAVRASVQAALGSLGVEVRPPPMTGITYVRSSGPD
jgi:hypothetical protein